MVAIEEIADVSLECEAGRHLDCRHVEGEVCVCICHSIDAHLPPSAAMILFIKKAA